MIKTRLTVALILSFQLGIQLAWANEIPSELAEWKDWVLHDQSYIQCPYFSDRNSGEKSNHICAWPHTLDLTVRQSSASFAVTWEVVEDSWVPLPGDTQSWPQGVLVDGNKALVQLHNNLPQLYLSAGVHRISGGFDWHSRPERISIPSQVADLKLNLDGQRVNFPVRQVNTLWLGETTNDEQVEANSLDIEVNRLIIDGHPMTMFMHIVLQVSGVARNERLGRVLGEGFQVTDVSGGLNAYIDQKGDLWAQLKPGRSELNVGININNWPSELKFVADGEHWPNQEIWAYQDNKNIRLTQVEGVVAINPEQSSSFWTAVPNYLVNDGDVFTINEQKRGTLNQSEQLSLSRQAWLSFDGEVFRTQDKINGDKFGSWRLNAGAGHQLLSASSHGETLLITESDAGAMGVELRNPLVNLSVDGEFSDSFLSQISGWQVDFEAVNTQLFLPHGYMVLATHNVDGSRNVWLEKWRLWDIFVVMLLTVLSFKVIGVKSALVAFLALVLGYHGLNMPLYSWANLIVVAAILAWLPMGKGLRLVQIYAVISFLSLAIALVSHLVTEARLMIHPQLENTHSQYSSSVSKDSRAPVVRKRLNQVYKQSYSNLNAVQAEPLMEVDGMADMVEESGQIKVTGSRIKRTDVLNRYQSDAVLQAGKGTPQWQYNSVHLSWDGPVTSDQTYHLILIKPWMRVIWRLLLIVSSLVWLVMIIQRMLPAFKVKKTAAKTLPVSFFLLVFMLFTQPTLAADFPTDELLSELKSRLTEPAKCQPQCATVESASVYAAGNELSVSLIYHVADEVLVPIPSSRDWSISEVLVNDRLAQARVQQHNKQWLHLKSGVQQVKLTGVLANRNTLSINFPLPPGNLSATSAQWQFAGLEGHRLSGNTLQMIATIQANTDDESQTTDIMAFVNIKRAITFDDQWYVDTEVVRVAPKTGVINLAVPLLKSEHPTEKVQLNSAGDIVVNMAANQNQFNWRSRLDRLPQIELKASNNRQFIETWEVISAPQWHTQISGVPLVASPNMEADDYFVHLYNPRPDEVLTIAVSRPKAVAGEVLSLDEVDHVYTVGKRTTKAVTTIKYRATQGGHFDVNLPASAVVKKVTFDGVESNLINEDGVVAVSYLPGSHQVGIQWHINDVLNNYHQTPMISLNNTYSNLKQTIKVPRDRWLLWGGSIGVGPAFLYWGELLVFFVLAFFLARIKYSPLKAWQWLLLGAAFGTFSWAAFSVVVVWLFFVGWKQHFDGFTERWKNILFQWGALFFTLFAVGVLIAAIASGLLSYPNMGVAGKNASSSQLYWYLDSGLNQLPIITLLNVHLWWYKLLILLWSIWVSFAMLSWLKQLLGGMSRDYWWPKFKTKNKTKAKEKKVESVATEKQLSEKDEET